MIGRLGPLVAALCIASCGADAPAGGSDASTEVEGGGPCGCLEIGPINWGLNGGFIFLSHPRSTLSACRSFSHHSGVFREEPPRLECTQQLGGCSDGVNAGDVTTALQHPDVQMALAVDHVVYGTDSRPVDGTVFDFQVQGAWVDVGGECSAGSSFCKPIPEGVGELVALLKRLTTQELARTPCSELFGSKDQ